MSDDNIIHFNPSIKDEANGGDGESAKILICTNCSNSLFLMVLHDGIAAPVCQHCQEFFNILADEFITYDSLLDDEDEEEV